MKLYEPLEKQMKRESEFATNNGDLVTGLLLVRNFNH